jgi:hypothetical protein
MYGNITDYRESKAMLGSTFFIKGADRIALRNFQAWQEKLND